MYNVRKVTEDLFWVGGNDRRLALFENIHPLYHGDRCQIGRAHV